MTYIITSPNKADETIELADLTQIKYLDTDHLTDEELQAIKWANKRTQQQFDLELRYSRVNEQRPIVLDPLNISIQFDVTFEDTGDCCEITKHFMEIHHEAEGPVFYRVEERGYDKDCGGFEDWRILERSKLPVSKEEFGLVVASALLRSSVSAHKQHTYSLGVERVLAESHDLIIFDELDEDEEDETGIGAFYYNNDIPFIKGVNHTYVKANPLSRHEAISRVEDIGYIDSDCYGYVGRMHNKEMLVLTPKVAPIFDDTNPFM